MTFSIEFDSSEQLDCYFVMQNRDRQDSQYRLWTIITAVAATVFAGMWIASQYLKASDAGRTSYNMLVASVGVAIITNLAYAWILFRTRPEENRQLSNKVNQSQGLKNSGEADK